MYNQGNRRRGSSPPLTCPKCSTVFYRTPSKRATYCSFACVVAAGAHIHTTPPEERFWQHVDKSGDCWLWTGSSAGNHGYGAFMLRPGKQIGAHVYAYGLASGTPPGDLLTLHACDVQRCVRNDEVGEYVVNGVARPRFGHLFLGTHDENMADRSAKLRQVHGERSIHARLTEQTVRRIRARYATGESQQHIAREYGVSQRAISAIVLGQSWRHVK